MIRNKETAGNRTYIYESDGKQFFDKKILNLAQLMNRSFTILGSRMYSPNLKDVAGLDDAQLIFNFPYICLRKTFPRTASTQPNLQTNV